PFFAGIIRGINSVLLETPMQLWLAMAQSKRERERVEHHLTRQHVDGVLLMSLHGVDRLPHLLAERGLPVVVCGQPGGELPLNAENMSCVDADDGGGARAAVARLLVQGRRRVAAIAGPQDMGVGVLRLQGYRQALTEAGQRVDESLIAYGDFSEASGTEAMRTLLDRHPDLDAVFCASDLMAVGAMRTLREYRRR